MRGPVRNVLAVCALATVVTAAIAAPVLLAPTERLFGMEIVGRHHDPFTVIAQFARPADAGLYWQPVTDSGGALLARIFGPVAAYNALVLLSFPLAAVAAYLLARHLGLARAGAMFAALAYAFSPFHLAHAAYHPHIAQTQWLPLYLVALWRCLECASPAAVALLVASAAAVALSNFYGGLIAAVITPVAVAVYWLVTCRAQPGAGRRLAITSGTLVVIGAAALGYAWWGASAVALDPMAFAFPRADLFRYSARWWSYLVPPVEHPLAGVAVLRFWNAAGVGPGLLEQQVSLGWGIVALGLIGISGWHIRPRRPFVPVVILVTIAAAAFLCSLSPPRTSGAFAFMRPSGILYEIVPMFRSYARFGLLVQLMAALLAGIGVDRLRRAGTTRARIAGVLLVTIAAAEYVVWPPDMSRDVLPTTAHRWAMRQPEARLVLDCVPMTLDSAHVESLTASRVQPLRGAVDDCLEPDLPRKLAARGYTHMLVRRNTNERRWMASRPTPGGLTLQAHLRDGDLFAVTAAAPSVYTSSITAFFAREQDGASTWRWMGHAGRWDVVNTRTGPVTATLDLEVWAFDTTRRLEIRLDGTRVQVLVIEPARRIYRVGPLTVSPGAHGILFHPVDPPTVAHDVVGNGDRRRLSFAVGQWTWSATRARP